MTEPSVAIKKFRMGDRRRWLGYKVAPAGAWKFPPYICCEASCRLAITVDKRCDWLEQLLHEY